MASRVIDNYIKRKEEALHRLTYSDMRTLHSIVVREAEYTARVADMYEKGNYPAIKERMRGAMLNGLAEKLETIINIQ